MGGEVEVGVPSFRGALEAETFLLPQREDIHNGKAKLHS